MSPAGSDWRESLREAAPYMHLGWQFCVAIALFCGAGYWLDQRLGTLPAFTVVGAVLAMVAIVGLVLQVSADAQARQERRERAQDGGGESG